MQFNQQIKKRIFTLKGEDEFEETALEVFKYQAFRNPVYKEFLNGMRADVNKISSIYQIPFLPVQLFKTHKVVTGSYPVEAIFTSSGTTGSITSSHYVTDISLYEESFFKCFNLFYGDPAEYGILALLPSYVERTGSSLIYMCEKLMEKGRHVENGFYLNNTDELLETISSLESRNKKYILIGVSFALLDLAEKHKLQIKHGIIIETGGMKGRRKEMIRSELHEQLMEGFNLPEIHSEYGMTELLSQAYSKGEGKFTCPPWMKVLIRDVNDPINLEKSNKSGGGVNIIDLANINSCSFIATQDLGKINTDGTFEIIGRFDNSDLRGCNLMIG